MKSIKRPLSLLELIIAMGLTMIILTTLLFFYHQTTVILRKTEIAENNAFKMLYVESRLNAILPRTAPSNDKDIEFFFFTDSDAAGLLKPGTDSLVFSFDNGVKLDKQVAYYVIGRLYLDKQGRLILAVLPTPKLWKEGEPILVRKEILMENVDTLSFQFFVPPERKNYTGWPPLESGKWISTWSKETKKAPPLVKIELTRNNERVTYIFHLPNTPQPIIFE